MKYISIIFTGMSLLIADSCFARGGFHHRQNHQRKRINQGVRTGNLPRDQAKELRGDLRQDRKERQALAADGRLSPEDRKTLRESQNETSRKIEEYKTDDITRAAKRPTMPAQN